MIVQTFCLLAIQLSRCVAPTAALPTNQKPLNDVDAFYQSVLQVRAELKKAEIIPTVVNDFIPGLTVSISWPKHNAALGNTIKPKHVQDQPSITLYDETNPDYCQTTNMTYVITLTDPDAPSRDNPEWSEMCHWVASGVPLGKTVLVLPVPFMGMKKESSLDEIMEYKPPGPPPKTGKHRYVFLVFAPSNRTTLPLDLSKPKERQHWGYGEERKGVREWAEENGLMPVAANFIYSQNKKQ